MSAPHERRPVIPRRKYFGKVSREPQPRRNEEIRISPLRVIDHNNKQVGVISRDEAMAIAREAGLDLVEIKSDVRPPICKVMDYGKYKYEQSKKKSQKVTNKANEVKEVRLGRSVKIDKHDVGIRINQALRFLLEGYKVMVVQRFRGREMAYPEIGLETLRKVGEALEEVAKVTKDPILAGRQMTMMLEPNKDKVAAYLKKHKPPEAVEIPEEEEDDDDDDDDDIDDVTSAEVNA
ncbi:MAG: translation initiation factor IF-3 [Myxococcales bacterium]|nr:translation initiation factor IF-3 [Myxococcales bacterium]MCB9651190.1 translation initiation factor IF-3 [Deltaproteobacteria bacterium]